MTNTKNTSDSQESQQSSRKPHTSHTSNTSQTSQEQEPEARRPKPMEVLREARAQLAELTGMNAESVSSFEQTEEGWALEVEVLELERVPDTMSLMASYQVQLDSEGQLTGYRRVRRYERGRSDARGSGGR
ncbi:gas vesicle protein [Streptomyces sp. AC512_CC834]|uniref:gas vesicle protein GvpO n=1 Tax=Streptomyces sp. AC512_CC834 TaxID=2823691 RepID=UPI001C25EE3F|nr:gas vesicle protein [Streptomyces sp. AC512_CC834]